MGVSGVMSGTDATMNFYPAQPFTAAARAAVEQKLGQSFDWPSDPMTRSATAQWLVDQLGW